MLHYIARICMYLSIIITKQFLFFLSNRGNEILPRFTRQIAIDWRIRWNVEAQWNSNPITRISCPFRIRTAYIDEARATIFLFTSVDRRGYLPGGCSVSASLVKTILRSGYRFWCRHYSVRGHVWFANTGINGEEISEILEISWKELRSLESLENKNWKLKLCVSNVESCLSVVINQCTYIQEVFFNFLFYFIILDK